MTASASDVGPRLAAARERSGFSQQEIATLVGQPRPVVSNWEKGLRQPNSHQLSKLSAILRVPLTALVGEAEAPRIDFERLLFRDAGDRLDEQGKYETQRFLAFLDDYAYLLAELGEPSGMAESPFSVAEGFTSKDDVRRKAADARAYFRTGMGPIADLAGMMDVAGIAVYRAPLGADLKTTVSGAFLGHPDVGFAVLINAETTPGRQRFTLAHELAHALFHGGKPSVNYFGRREAGERFANGFAAEFLVPTQSLRSAVESLGETHVTDPEVVVHLQRLFGVSYAMMLVRLRSAHLISEVGVDRLRGVRPVHTAQRLGYSTDVDEWSEDSERWGLARFPRRFLRLLSRALKGGQVTVSGAASMTGLALEDIEEFANVTTSEGEEEFEYFSASA